MSGSHLVCSLLFCMASIGDLRCYADVRGLGQALRAAKSGAQLPAPHRAQRRVPQCMIRAQAALDKHKVPRLAVSASPGARAHGLCHRPAYHGELQALCGQS